MILEHTVGLFTHPDEEWATIRTHHESAPELYIQQHPAACDDTCYCSVLWHYADRLDAWH